MSGRANMTRVDDALSLLMLAMRAKGMTSRQIAAGLCLHDSAVRTATNRVLDDDLALSGEPSETVLAAYGWRA